MYKNQDGALAGTTVVAGAINEVGRQTRGTVQAEETRRPHVPLKGGRSNLPVGVGTVSARPGTEKTAGRAPPCARKPVPKPGLAQGHPGCAPALSLCLLDIVRTQHPQSFSKAPHPSTSLASTSLSAGMCRTSSKINDSPVRLTQLTQEHLDAQHPTSC